MLAEQTGAPPAVAASLAYLTDRWDGKGPLRRAAADAIPLSMRMVRARWSTRRCSATWRARSSRRG